MEKANRNRLVRFGLLLVAIIFFAIGINLTETNANELSYGIDEEFVVEEGMEDQTILVFTEVTEGNCPGFTFEVRDDEGAPVAMEKMDCSKWYDGDSWQYRIDALEAGEYTYTASDYASIVAVSGDVNAYLENYQLGNSLADLGGCFCCLSFVVPLILGRLSKQALDPANQIQLTDSFVMPTPYEGPSESPSTALDAEDHGAESATEEPDAEPATEVEDEESTAEVQDVEAATEKEDEQPDGAFWGGLNND